MKITIPVTSQVIFIFNSRNNFYNSKKWKQIQLRIIFEVSNINKANVVLITAQSVFQLPKIDKENFSTFRPEGLRQES